MQYVSYRDTAMYYEWCLAQAAAMPPGESRNWWYIRAGSVYQWGETR